MPAGEELYKVQAITLLPDFIDYYGAHGDIGDTYNPSAVGEWGFMYETEALAGEGTSVLLHRNNTLLGMEQAVPSELALSASFQDGVVDAPGLIFVPGGTWDDDYDITVTVDVDDGGDEVLVAQVTAGETAVETGAAIAALEFAGCTLTEQSDHDVTVTPDEDSALTNLTVAVAATV